MSSSMTSPSASSVASMSTRRRPAAGLGVPATSLSTSSPRMGHATLSATGPPTPRHCTKSSSTSGEMPFWERSKRRKRCPWAQQLAASAAPRLMRPLPRKKSSSKMPAPPAFAAAASRAYWRPVSPSALKERPKSPQGTAARPQEVPRGRVARNPPRSASANGAAPWGPKPQSETSRAAKPQRSASASCGPASGPSGLLAKLRCRRLPFAA
mmetsp:Transcript_82813/g.184895  ORF Transcript_82813/g.184895 Transcript_82813/m.184895 type:complete len:211 (-) Transcript_82813:644-1276(-)